MQTRRIPTQRVSSISFRQAVGAVFIIAFTSGLLAHSPAGAVASGPGTFEGTIGSAKVVMLIDTTTWKGAYFYRSSGRDIAVSGSPAKLGEVDPDESTNPERKVTAEFNGKLSADGTMYTGTWTSKVRTTSAAFSLKRTGGASPGTKKRAGVKSKVTKTKSDSGLEVTYKLPEITSLTPDWIATRITGTASALAFSGRSLSDAVAEFQPNGLGVTSVTFDVPFNDNQLLNLILRTETEQAYPDHFEHYALFDLRNGKRLQADDLWARPTKAKLVALLQRKLNRNITEALRDPADESSGLTPELVPTIGKTTIDDETLASITIQKQGIVLTHEFGFPHAVEASEPDGTLKLSWAELRPFRRAGSPFASLG
jgi:hypothetical protein